MKPLKKRLLSLKEEIRVSVIGCGQKGKNLVCQAQATPGIRPVAIADHYLEKAVECAKRLTRDYEIVKTVDQLNRAIERGRLAITDQAEMIASSELVNVMIEASGALAEGCIHAMRAIQHHQHVVMANEKTDLMYGPLLLQLANEEGVVYTSCDGSSHAALKKLCDDVDFWGMELVMAGIIASAKDLERPTLKVFRESDGPSAWHQHAATIAGITERNIALSILANSINAGATSAALHIPHVENIHDIVKNPERYEALRNSSGVVSNVLCTEPSHGVYVVARTEHKFQQSALNTTDNLGPNYVFYKPHQAGLLEAMECVMEAYFNGTARLHPYYGMKTNVFAHARRDLRKGDTLDGLSGEKTFGVIGDLDNNKHFPGLPICLSSGLRLVNDVAKDAVITMEDVRYDVDDLPFSLYFRALQANTQRTVFKKAKVAEENLPYIIPMI